MKIFSKALGLISIAALAQPASAATTESFAYNGLSLLIPDGNPSGLANNQTVSTMITEIEAITVSLNITGSYNGDLYVYLSHDSGLSVLLSRTGRTAANAFGYDDDGFNVTFDDTAPDNIHTYQTITIPAAATQLTGTWQPDGRTTDPGSVVDTDPSTAPLSVFNGLDGNGTWTLFLADLSGGETHTLQSWSLNITGVPEPSTAFLGLFSLSLVAFYRRRV